LTIDSLQLTIILFLTFAYHAERNEESCFCGDFMDDYLYAILALGDARDPVRMTDVALRLGIAKASVSRAVRLLSERGFVCYERYGTVTLTERGAELARGIRCRRSLFKLFLVERLGVEPDIAERDAGRMERAASAETVAALENFMK
jgi:DtxR family Mn-dependent transcriptional regulator